MITYLVCEGDPDGLDARVLNRIIAQKMRLPVQIETAGSGSSLGSVATWLEKRGHRAYTIKDRDYRLREQVERYWEANSKRLMWYRHEIENYLLDPRIVLAAFHQLRKDDIRGAKSLPDDSASIEELLRSLAVPLLVNHTGRCAYWALYAYVPVDEVCLKLPRPSGNNSNREGWLDYLESEGRRFQSVCGCLANDERFQRSAIESEFDKVWDYVAASQFLDSGLFIEEMDGHELLSALSSYVNRAGVSHLSLPDLENELLKALDSLYSDSFFVSDDFTKLAERLR